MALATASQLSRFLALIRQYLQRILRGGILPQALTQLLRRLAILQSFFRHRRYAWRKSAGRVDKPPSPDIAGFRKGSEPLEPSKEQSLHSEILQANSQYTTNPNGETISLNNDNIAFSSLYPLSGKGIRDGSRSSQNLDASRSSHNRAMASRSAQHLGGSEYANSAHSGFEIGDPITITVESAPPESPIPVRKYSASFPQIPHHNGESFKPHTENSSPLDVERISVTSFGIPTRPTSILSASTRPASPSPLRICMDNDRIVPVMPESTTRYTDRPRIKKAWTNMIIQPLTTTFEQSPVRPGWIKYTHPEGGRYFFNEEKRVYTDADLDDFKIFIQLTQDIATLDGFISANFITLPENTDLVLNLSNGQVGDIPTTYYYYVHHESRTIFFLDTFEANSLNAWTEAPGATNDSHLRHEIEAQYWFFLQLYPHSREVSEDLASELKGIIFFFIGDNMTSPSSTSPYSLSDLHTLLPVADRLQKNLGKKSAGATDFLARLMWMFVHTRFLNFYGEPCARIERHYSVYGTPIVSRTWFIKLISPLLFSAPDFHLQTLQKMWVDGLMHKPVWVEAVKKMNDEWQEFVLFATVMLNANVAFLSINSVDINCDPYRSPAQISSYLSVVASIGSIVLGLLLMRQNRTKSRETADEMQTFMVTRNHPRLGLETLAILYSLPYALLMWGMLSFLIAFSFMCFQHSSIHSRTVVGSFCFLIVILVFWCVSTLWEEQPEEKPVNCAAESDEKDTQGSYTTAEQAVDQPTILSNFPWLPPFLKRRESIDSEGTMVQQA